MNYEVEVLGQMVIAFIAANGSRLKKILFRY